MNVKQELEHWAEKRNSKSELSSSASPDPLQVSARYKDEYVCLVCALFAYGNARAIVKFLNSLDFSVLDKDKTSIEKSSMDKIYRFQNSRDISEFFYTLSLLKKQNSLEEVFFQGYKKEYKVIDGIASLLQTLYELNPYRSRGYEFLLGKIPTKKVASPYKRWNMYLRWMVRKDELDLGLWSKVDKAHLLAPLDTHTHKMALRLGLIERKTYDFKACLELTEAFKSFDGNDPIKYDFALYRLGQEKILKD